MAINHCLFFHTPQQRVFFILLNDRLNSLILPNGIKFYVIGFSINYFLVAIRENTLDEVDKFLGEKKHNLPKLTSKERENLKKPIAFKENGFLRIDY